MLRDKLNDIFPFNPKVEIDEKINTCDLLVKCNELPQVNESTLNNILNLIQPDDSFNLSIKIDENEPITINKIDDINSFINQFRNDSKYFEEEEQIEFKLQIDKSKAKEKRTVYSYQSFLSFWNNINSVDLLDVLNDLLIENQSVRFYSIDKCLPSFATSHISFNYDLPKPPIFTDKPLLKEQCHFGNSEQYLLRPDHFHLTNRENKDLSDKIDILCCLFSIIYLFDISSIKNSKLHYKLNGYKAISGDMIIDDKLIKSATLYYKLYNWCYSSEGNVTDKLGLARNLMSIHFNQHITDLDESILTSVKSSYKTYLKENVSKYIEIRGKILDELNWISQKSGEIVEKYLSNYQKSIFTFLSFFISVFLLKVLSKGEFTNVFNKDSTILTLAFLVLSVVFLIFSSWNLSVEKRRLHRKYENIKNRFKDLLIEKDIENILNNDEEFKYESSFISKRYESYLWLWIITILILLIAVISVSDYLNWSVIFELITNIFMEKHLGSISLIKFS